MTNECGIGIRVHDSLAAWQGNPGPSPRGSAHRLSVATQTTTWPFTRPAPQPKAYPSATTSPASWRKLTASTSRPISTGAATNPSCYSIPGRETDLEMRRAPRDLESAGGSSNHPDEEGRSVLTCASVPANAFVARGVVSTRRHECPLPLPAPPGYSVSTRHDTSVHNGGTCDRSRYRSSDAAAADSTPTTHSRRQHRPLPMARRGTAQGPADHGRSNSSGARALPGRRGASSPSRREGRRARTAAGGKHFVGTHKGPRLNLWPDRRDPFMSNTQRVLRTCAHRKGTANERIRARLG